MSTFPRDLLSALRADGFRRTYVDRHVKYGMCTYEKVVGERTVDVQLWHDGRHRASHWIDGRMCTLPTEFADIAGMRAAVKHELERKDHPAPGQPVRGTMVLMPEGRR